MLQVNNKLFIQTEQRNETQICDSQQKVAILHHKII